jgi:hypothetical protein
MQAYQQKTEKFFVSEEKKFGRIDSWMNKVFLPVLAPILALISRSMVDRLCNIRP